MGSNKITIIKNKCRIFVTKDEEELPSLEDAEKIIKDAGIDVEEFTKKARKIFRKIILRFIKIIY